MEEARVSISLNDPVIPGFYKPKFLLVLKNFKILLSKMAFQV